MLEELQRQGHNLDEISPDLSVSCCSVSIGDPNVACMHMQLAQLGLKGISMQHTCSSARTSGNTTDLLAAWRVPYACSRCCAMSKRRRDSRQMTCPLRRSHLSQGRVRAGCRIGQDEGR